MNAFEAVMVFVAVPLVLLGGLWGEPGEPGRPDCGDNVASQEVCEEVVARANEVGTVPEKHEQRDRARGG